MRILYGIQGTGNGHLTRSARMVKALQADGCDVEVLLSGTYAKIEADIPVRHEMKGFTFKHKRDGSVDYVKTFFSLDFRRFVKDIRLDLKAYDRVIADYEPVVTWAGKWQDVDVTGLSNQYSFLSDKTPRPAHRDPVAEMVMTHFAPVSRPIGLHFERYDDFIHLPILRQEVLDMDVEDRGHYAVYIPNQPLPALLAELNRHKADRFEVFSNAVKSPSTEGNCRLQPTSGAGFMESFRTSRGVITRAGFQTTAEALYVGKKLLALPLAKQYEQECNAAALAGMGVATGTLRDVEAFLQTPPALPRPWADPVPGLVSTLLA